MNPSLKYSTLRSIGSALLLFAAGCSSPVAQRAQRADGLLGFVFDSPGRNIVPVERFSTNGGTVVTAHATASETQLRVSGIVRRGSAEPPPGSHIDVLVLDARGHITATAATEFLPHPPPHPSSRYGPGNAHYSARFPLIPANGSTVRVVFHGISKRQCAFSAGS